MGWGCPLPIHFSAVLSISSHVLSHFSLQLRVSAGSGSHGEHPEAGRGGKKRLGMNLGGFPACATMETHAAGAHTANPAVDGGWTHKPYPSTPKEVFGVFSGVSPKPEWGTQP